MITLIALKAFAAPILKFLATYWKHILLAILAAIVLWRVHEHGYNSADDKWIKHTNTQVRTLNAKIKTLEDTAKTGNEELKKSNAKMKERLVELVSETPTVVLHDKAGNVVQCNNKTTEVYLGSDFASTWNNINKESEKTK